MRRSVLSGIATVLFCMAAVQLFLWYDTQQLMDRWIRDLTPFATVRYRSVHGSLFGSVGLNELRITPVGSDETYSIKRLRVITPGPLSLFQARNALRSNRLPPIVSVRLEHLQAGLFGDAFTLLRPFSLAQACGDKEFLQPEDLVALGIKEIGLDLGVTVADRGDDLAVGLSLDVDQLASLRIQARVDAFSGMPPEFLEIPPAPSSLVFNMTDRGFNQQKLRYCAEQGSTSITRFISQHIEAIEESLSHLGIIANQGLINGYARFLAADKGHMELRLTLNGESDPTSTPRGWLNFLNGADINLVVNDRPVNNPQLALDPVIWEQRLASYASPSAVGEPNEKSQSVSPEITTGAMTGLDLERVSAIAVTAEEATSSTSMEVSYRQLPREDLDLHIGKRVIIDTINGNQHRGFIEGFERGRLTIRIPLRSGSVAIPVRADGIAQIQVQTE